MSRRVVITGIGVISPLGFGRAAFWEALLEGRSGLAPIEGIDVSAYSAKTGGEVRNFHAEDFLGKKGLRYLNWGTKMLTSAVKLALDDARLEANDDLGEKTGIVIGSALANYPQTTNYTQMTLQRGVEDLLPMESYDVALNASINYASVWFKLKPFARTIASGFTASLDAIADAAEAIRQGLSDTAIAGGVEQLSIDAYLLFYWQKMLAGRKHDSTESAVESSQPFGQERNGFVLSEGSYVVILEELESALRRGVPVYAEVAGHNSLYIGAPVFSTEQKVDKTARTMLAALSESSVEVSNVGFVSAGANSSVETDFIEAAALGNVGLNAPVTAIKSIMGECYGAGGAMLVVASALALHNHRLPATIGDYTLASDVNIGLVREPRALGSGSALINSLDPQGNCSCLVLNPMA